MIRTVASTACITLAAAGLAHAQEPPCDAFCHPRLADRAEAAGDLAAYQRHVRAVAAVAPGHPGVVCAMARVFTRAGSPDSVTTASLDGLYWHHGSLLAVQGLPTLERVVRYVLSDDGRRVERGLVLERGLPVVHHPTTGTIVGSRFYYIANSQYDRLSDAGGPLQPQAGPAVRTAVRVIELRW